MSGPRQTVYHVLPFPLLFSITISAMSPLHVMSTVARDRMLLLWQWLIVGVWWVAQAANDVDGCEPGGKIP